MSRPNFKPILVGACLAIVAGTVFFALRVHSFLAPVQPIAADVLVVEGWVPDEVAVGAVAEIDRGGYRHVFVSRLLSEGPPGPNARRIYDRLLELGVNPDILHDAPAPFTRIHRTATTARGVKQKLQELGLRPEGINLISGGPHSRQSWLAYERIMSDTSAVGIIAIRKGHYNPAAWWMSKQGLHWVLKDFAGWVKECLLGPRT